MMEGGGGVPSHGVIKPCRNGEKKYLPRAILEWTRGAIEYTFIYSIYRVMGADRLNQPLRPLY